MHCSDKLPEREERAQTQVEAVKLANRSTDTFDWQQNQPMEGFKLLPWFNLSLVSLVKFLSGLKSFDLLNPYRFNCLSVDTYIYMCVVCEK